MKNSWKLAVLVLVLAGYAAAGFSVIHLEGIPRYVRNGATTPAAGGEGLSFPTPGLARTPGPPRWLAEVARTSSIAVEVEARSFSPRQTGPARILTLSEGTSLRDLTLGQDGPDLVIRLRTTSTSLNGEPAHTLSGALGDGRFHRIRVEVSGNRFQATLDGKMVESAALPESPLSGWDTGYSLLLGNEVGGQRPWLGEIRKATVQAGGRTYEYGGKRALEVPGHFWMMGPPPSYSGPGGGGAPGAARPAWRRDLRDWSLNFLGFMPLGFLLVLLWSRLSVFRAVLVCALLSLAIETVQMLLPGRDPQWSDILLNTLGGLFGALAGRGLGRLLRSFRASRPS